LEPAIDQRNEQGGHQTGENGGPEKCDDVDL